ncbi:sugar ABC transporter substrate-binding protein [Achromobacter ruhlandii]|jgi:simple sugar transport system substrate-binding protein/ribose transport system substrate-binding protein|uniref:Periplasmic binding protein domain-containing protein n=2 Tax=Achromobacter TaxID=222 RepID=A0ABM8LNZ9_9BURK|nr:substrate-binding domain-containing protein [Achromobacter ruhlandii]AKP92240.1 Periplasmic binding proteins and sugar binding domain of LacI family protein [Achromobacter xylosoxidans]AOU95500.1 type I periplasmic binding superfamily protein [Achromobacter ruhlandii]MCZ8434111.1 substrate-binding domain-containing protein [Achromobacter ruhlandii]MDC6091670.1 substrate-binding domain-containing protein [Achromobacter ruhlandii]MDC6152878.1 substrate-binding domain-containing protein [Achro
MNRFIKRTLLLGAFAAQALAASAAHAFDVGVVAFQMSSETHARAANAAAEAARAKGWTVTQLNAEGSLPKLAEQLDTLVNKKVDAIVIAMGKPVETDAQLQAAKEKGIAVVGVMSGASPHMLFDVEVNEYATGAQSVLYLLGKMGYQGNILSARFDGNSGTRIRGKMLDAVLSENTAVKDLAKFSMARTQSWRDDVRNGMQALFLRNQGQFKGVWASFDGQAYVIDDLLQAQGMKKGDITLVSVDGGPETYRRIADPNSLITATMMIPFEQLGVTAVDAIDRIVVKKEAKDKIASGPYLFMDSVLVDASNVQKFLTPAK